MCIIDTFHFIMSYTQHTNPIALYCYWNFLPIIIIKIMNREHITEFIIKKATISSRNSKKDFMRCLFASILIHIDIYYICGVFMCHAFLCNFKTIPHHTIHIYRPKDNAHLKLKLSFCFFSVVFENLEHCLGIYTVRHSYTGKCAHS